jgi:predicted RNA-binding protein YlxR (DUF448 family)
VAAPIRSCRVCRQRADKSQLQRWVRIDGHWEYDEKQTTPGRGYYACSDEHAQKLPQIVRNKR